MLPNCDLSIVFSGISHDPAQSRQVQIFLNHFPWISYNPAMPGQQTGPLTGHHVVAVPRNATFSKNRISPYRAVTTSVRCRAESSMTSSVSKLSQPDPIVILKATNRFIFNETKQIKRNHLSDCFRANYPNSVINDFLSTIKHVIINITVMWSFVFSYCTYTKAFSISSTFTPIKRHRATRALHFHYKGIT